MNVDYFAFISVLTEKSAICRLRIPHRCDPKKASGVYIKANSCVCGYAGADFIHQRFVAFIEAFPKFLVEENGLDKSWFSIAFHLFLLYFFPILFPMTRSKV